PREPRARGPRIAGAHRRLEPEAEVVTQQYETIDDAPVPGDERKRRHGRIGRLDEVEGPELPQGPPVGARQRAVGGDAAQVVVPGPEAVDPRDSAVEELPPPLQVEPFGEKRHRCREGAYAVRLRQGRKDRGV